MLFVKHFKYDKYMLIKTFDIQKVEMTNKTFRLPVVLVEKLSMLAQCNNISLNNLVKQCCEYALLNLDKTIYP